MSSTEPVRPRRGEIWIANLDPTQGAEIKKRRPVIIVSSDGVGRLPIKMVAPITDWKPAFANSFWHIHLVPDGNNGLSKESAVDALQLRGIDTGRLISCTSCQIASKSLRCGVGDGGLVVLQSPAIL